MDKKSDRRAWACMRMPHRVRDRQQRFLPRQRFADNSGKKTGCRLVWFARAHANGRQSDTDAVKKFAARVVSEQQFANCLLCSVGGQRREMKVIGNGSGKWRTENGDRGRKHDFGFVVGSADRLEKCATPIKIDTIALLEIGFRFAGNHTSQMKDHVGLVRDSLCRRPRAGKVARREIYRSCK